MADFSATEGNVFKQCATKGTVLKTKCVTERVWVFKRLSQREWKLSKFVLHAKMNFMDMCQEGEFGQNFALVRVGFRKLCVSEGRGFAVPS